MLRFFDRKGRLRLLGHHRNGVMVSCLADVLVSAAGGVGGDDGAGGATDGSANDGVGGGVGVEAGGAGGSLVSWRYQGGHLLEDQPRRRMSCRTG